MITMGGSTTSAVAPTAVRGEKIMLGATTVKQLSDVRVMGRARYVTPTSG
jgi:hypothetical protein